MLWATCAGTLIRPLKQSSRHYAHAVPSLYPQRTRRGWVFLGGASLLGLSLYATSASVRDDVDFTAHAIQRSSTVAFALSRCVWAYRATLKAQYASDDARQEALRQCHTKCALITRDALERNGGIFIKLGQHISALTYIFPPEWTQPMIALQDKGPVSSPASVEELLLEDMGSSIEDLFEEFDTEPIGTASLAQVHHAKLRGSGQEVAVKVQHPGLRRYVPLDVRLTEKVFQLVDYFFPEYPLTWLSDEMKRSIFTELDFTKEAENAESTRKHFAPLFKNTALRIPDVYWAKPRVLCMEFLRGFRPDDLEKLDAAGIDRADLSLCFANIFNEMIFTPGVGLHCDPHGGNIAIIPRPRTANNKHGFEVVLYDHGLYRYIATPIRVSYAHFWLALMDGDVDKMRKYAHEFAGIDDEDFKVFAAAITGRDFTNAMDGSVMRKPRSADEIAHMQQQLQEDDGLASQVMRMLRNMPPVVLLILKTNDLVRYLDETLGSPLGIKRQFVVMAEYCANTIYVTNKRGGAWIWLKAWATKLWVDLRLVLISLLPV